MSKHVGDVKRLLSKLIARYGADDDLVEQVSTELELLKAIESKRTQGFAIHETLRTNANVLMQSPVSV